MEMSNLPQRTKVRVALEYIKPNDIIFLSNRDNADSYLVLDTGKPFILIENQRTHFANMYRVVFDVYKEQ